MKSSVGMKIGGGFALAAALLLIIGGVSYWGTKQFTDVTVAITQNQALLEKMDHTVNGLYKAQTHQRGYLITGSESFLLPYRDAIAQAEQTLKELKTALVSPYAQKIFVSIDPLFSEVRKNLEDEIALRRDKGIEAVRQVILSDRGRKNFEATVKLVSDLDNEEQQNLKQRQEESHRSAQISKYIDLLGIPLALVFLGLAGVIITRNISNPLKSMSFAAERMATGDIDFEPVTYKRGDEVGVLAETFRKLMEYQQEMSEISHQIALGNLKVKVTPRSDKDILGAAALTMVENMRQQIEQIMEGVNSLAASASEIMATTTQIASSASESATAVTETTTTIEELRQTVQVSNQKAKDVSENARQATVVSKTGKTSVDTVIEGMHRIQQQMDAIAESIIKLSEQSQTIGDIIATVSDIADQSNLLAVNASIEAAKAGEQGKGFSVVAQEVRNLAEQSKQATAQVRAILNDIQKAISAAVMATEQGSKAVDSGVKQSAEAGDSIRVLAEGVTASAQASLQIAASTNEQLIGMDQVTLAMENIKQASEQNVAGIRQAETAAQNLHELGQSLKHLVERYQV
jgi:methyl-accepting chemotaxis protein